MLCYYKGGQTRNLTHIMKQSFLFLLFSFSLFAQKNIESFDSKKIGGKRHITVGLPVSYESNPTKKYPILTLLADEYLFEPFYGTLNYGAYKDDLPEAIIVGISQNLHNEREKNCGFYPTNSPPTTKATRFFGFIEGELFPYIEQKYCAAPFKRIAGHDTTARFFNFYILKEKPFFNAYISLSSALAPRMDSQKANSSANTKKQVFYYQSYAAGAIQQLRAPVKQLDKNIKAIANPLVAYKFSLLPNPSHYSLVLYSIPEAVYQIFGSYKPTSSTEFSEKIIVLKEGNDDYLTNKYTIISYKLGLKIPIRTNAFKAFEAAILKNNEHYEVDKLSDLANKKYRKSVLASNELRLVDEKIGNAKITTGICHRAPQLQEISYLTKEMMYKKYDDMKSITIKT